MRTACGLVKTNILPFIEPIKEGVRKKWSHTQVCDGAFFQDLSWLAKLGDISWYEPIRNGVRWPVVLRGLTWSSLGKQQ